MSPHRNVHISILGFTNVDILRSTILADELTESLKVS